MRGKSGGPAVGELAPVAAKKAPVWDYYLDKQLETLLQEYEFDFSRTADTFNLITKSEAYTKEICQERYTELYEERKRGEHTAMREKMENFLQDKPIRKSIYEIFKELPAERTERDYLRVTKEDLANAFSVSSITGEIIRPSGFNVVSDKLFPDEYLAEKHKREQEFLESFNIKKELDEIDSRSGPEEMDITEPKRFQMFYIERDDQGDLIPGQVDMFSGKAREIMHRKLLEKKRLLEGQAEIQDTEEMGAFDIDAAYTGPSVAHRPLTTDYQEDGEEGEEEADDDYEKIVQSRKKLLDPKKTWQEDEQQLAKPKGYSRAALYSQQEEAATQSAGEQP